MSQRNRENVGGEVQIASIEVYIDEERGLIERLEYGISVERSGGLVAAGFVFRMVDIGSWEVSQPDWLDEAKEQTGETSEQPGRSDSPVDHVHPSPPASVTFVESETPAA